MDLASILFVIAAFVHAHVAFVSVATAVVILGLVLGDLEDFLLYGLKKGWRALLSLSIIFGIIGADAANATVAGVAALAFLGALGAKASLGDAALTAIVAIGTVNTVFLLGADRNKLLEIWQLLFPAPPEPLKARTR